MLTDSRGVLALFAVADTVKDTSLAAIAELHALGIKTLMLTGDNPHTAEAIAAQVGIDEARGNQLPEDKAAAVAAKLGPAGMAGMAGDGINDASALALATYRVLVQNIALALGIKAVFLVLTLMGLGTLWMAVFADMGASLLVAFNGLRLLRQ